LKVVQLLLIVTLAALSACNKKQTAPPPVTTQDYKKAVSFLDHQNDSAYYYFNTVATTSRDSLLIAAAYYYMAQIQSDAGDYYGGQETLLASLRYLHDTTEKDKAYLGADYNLLGRTSQNLKNYNAAIEYYNRALAWTKNEAYRAIILNNIAVAYSDKKQYTQAIAIYDSILIQSKKSKKEYARVLTNLAMARWQQDPAYPAAAALLMALELRTAEKDDWGLNSSYAHLADYYQRTRPDSALHYAHNMYAVASLLQSPDNQLEALQKLISLSPEKQAKRYFVQYQRINDSLQTARNAAKNQFALIRFEAERSKTENLRLQHENAQKQVQILRQRVILYSSLAVFVLIVASLTSLHRRRKLQIESEARNQLLHASQKVHDVVANGLYRVISQIEHTDTLEMPELLDKLEVLYEQSRELSYDLPENSSHPYHQIMGDMLKAFADPETRVSIVGNEEDLWAKIGSTAKTEVELVMQELMTNMRKHSGARNVLVRFEHQGDQINIRYSDDGTGFPPDTPFGNGLTSTGNRIKSISGRIIFDNNTPRGLKIEIQFPIA
jgi:tetratricopeptide (TPR) repeat protein